MWPDRVSKPGPLSYESGALPTALCGPASLINTVLILLCHVIYNLSEIKAIFCLSVNLRSGVIYQ